MEFLMANTLLDVGTVAAANGSEFTAVLGSLNLYL